MLKHKIDLNVEYSSNTVQNPRLNSIDLCSAGSMGFHALNCIQNSHNGYQKYFISIISIIKKETLNVYFFHLFWILSLFRPALSHWFARILHVTEEAACVISCMIYCVRVRVSGEHIGLPPLGPPSAISWSPWKDGVFQGQRSTGIPQHPLDLSMYYHIFTITASTVHCFLCYIQCLFHCVCACSFFLNIDYLHLFMIYLFTFR